MKGARNWDKWVKKSKERKKTHGCSLNLAKIPIALHRFSLPGASRFDSILVINAFLIKLNL